MPRSPEPSGAGPRLARAARAVRRLSHDTAASLVPDRSVGPANARSYVGARYYRPDLGRFTTVDPDHVNGEIGDSQSWNGYASVRNNPLRYADPSGTAYWIFADDGSPFWLNTDSLDAVRTFLDGYSIEGGIFAGIIKNRFGAQVGSYEWFNLDVNPRKESWSDWFSRNILDLVPFTATLQAPGLGEADLPLVNRSPDTAFLVAASILPGLGARAALGTRSTALLTQAAMTVGNKGAVAASRDVALAAAEEWVGIGARLIRSRSGQVVGKISADGHRIYRTTSMGKARPYINLENKATGGNLHIRW